MMNQQASELLIDICQKIITHLATENKVTPENIRLRIDLENAHAKPVFALFDESRFMTRIPLKELIQAGGGAGMSMLAGMYIKNVLRDIFKAAAQRFETPVKSVFILLFQKGTNPMMALFLHGENQDCFPIAQILEMANQNNDHDK